MSTTYNAQTRCWTLDGPGMLWTNTRGGAPSHTIGPKYVQRLVFYPTAKDDDIIFQENTTTETAFSLKAGASDASPVTLDFSAENGGRGRRFVGLKCSTFDGLTSTAELFIS